MASKLPTLLDSWKVTRDEIDEILSENPSMRGLVFGYVAEFKLRKIIQEDKRLKYLGKPDDHDRRKKSDLQIQYKTQVITLEVKSLQSNSIKNEGGGNYSGRFQCDASDRRPVQFPDGSTVQTTCLLAGQFDILGVCMFEFGKEWRFAFALNRDLPRSKYKAYTEYQRKYLLASTIPISLPLASPFTFDLIGLCDQIAKERSSP